MNPIFEKGHGEGLGYDYDQFIARFVQICNSHLQGHRAESFALILYGERDHALRHALATRATFTGLDRLSAKDLTIFFLDGGLRRIAEQFNRSFASLFQVPDDIRPPYILFFRIEDDDARDIEFKALWETDPTLLYRELYNLVEDHLGEMKPKKKRNFNLRGIAKTGIHIATEVTIAKLLEHLTNSKS